MLPTCVSGCTKNHLEQPKGISIDTSSGIQPIGTTTHLWSLVGNGDKKHDCDDWFFVGCLETHLHVNKPLGGFNGRIEAENTEIKEWNILHSKSLNKTAEAARQKGEA